MHVELEEIEPHRVAGIGLRPHDPDLEVPEFTDLDQVHAYMGRLAESNKFAGVVLVERRGEPRFLRAYGTANKEKGVRPRTR
jgi:hypothetical protein